MSTANESLFLYLPGDAIKRHSYRVRGGLFWRTQDFELPMVISISFFGSRRGGGFLRQTSCKEFARLADLKDPSKKTSENEFKSFCTHKRFDNTYEKLAYDSLFIRLHT